MKDFNFDPNIFNKNALDEKFNNFWKSLIKNFLISEEDIDKKKCEFLERTFRMQKEFNEFYQFIEKTPFVLTLYQWLKIQAYENHTNFNFSLVKDLIDEKILLIKDKEEKLLTLKDLKDKTHEKILENIRCIDRWNFYEKEQYVRIYLEFSFFLAKNTFNYISVAIDPDREKTFSRFVKYETFIEFLTNLSKRDSLIAKVLYFGAPTIEEAVSLKFSQINRKEGKVNFSSKIVNYPKHLLEELFSFLKKEKKDSLVFVNVKGKEVERSHLNQSFLRASNKMSNAIKITPGMLLKHKETFSENNETTVK